MAVVKFILTSPFNQTASARRKRRALIFLATSILLAEIKKKW